MKSLRRRLMGIIDINVPYIKTSGEQLINTNWIPLVDTKIQLYLHLKDCREESNLKNTWFVSPSGDNHYVFTANNGGEGDQWNQLYQWNGLAYDYGGKILTINCAAYYNSTVPLYYSLETTKSTYYYNGSYRDCTLNKREDYGGNPLTLFGDRNGAYNRATMYIYGVKCWNNGVLERDFVPAKKNGRYGLYDKVQCKFWYSSTGVDFLGPDE